MEFVIVYIIIAVILCMLTGRLFFMVFAVFSLFILISAVLNVYFLYMLTGLFGSKRKTGEFLRVESVKNNIFNTGRAIGYKVAVYRIEDKEYESVFPAEGLFGVYFYRPSKRGGLRLDVKRGKVFDKYNIASCIMWPVFCTMLCAAMLYALALFHRMGI